MKWLPGSPEISYPVYNIHPTDRSNLLNSSKDQQVPTTYQVDFTKFHTDNTERPAVIYRQTGRDRVGPIEVGPLVGLAFREIKRLLLPFCKGGMVVAEKVTTLFIILLDFDNTGANVYSTSWL